MESTQIYAKQAQAELEQLDAEIRKLDARSDLILAKIEERHYRVLKDLRQKEGLMDGMLQQLKGADDSACKCLRAQIEEVEHDLIHSLNVATEELTLPA
jgi:hypothetical protein